MMSFFTLFFLLSPDGLTFEPIEVFDDATQCAAVMSTYSDAPVGYSLHCESTGELSGTPRPYRKEKGTDK